ncbi:hypothetical protein COY90_05125 [Candidatus Roizmanbacteria bacterium CG_4_10_14_0_8_um_filter_39_9]|uniref:Uncharacterized protein n=1 Tax=Candidatus Roizmanbacteria bacterium CG_4_10_14_0_8_um_filter_39_9 TaxID=1974829 RepID=A0A2M7QBK7_9BACT|nr:MAG: hypothetical protein COY90_05125 [Candidatus Roizmanbacteria bacterium CG_4_10_14_0_8_um_filter_39_9]
MKKRINLFARKKRFDSFVSYSVNIRKYGAVVGVLLFCLFMFFVYLVVNTQRRMSDLTKQKQQYLSYLLTEKDTEASIRFFKGKQTQLTKFLSDDAQFVSYYAILRNALMDSTESAVLDSVEIDKNRDTVFVVRFQTYESMVSFLKYVESTEFLRFFDELSMASLNLTRDVSAVAKTSSVKNYQLQFKGKFKAINE